MQCQQSSFTNSWIPSPHMPHLSNYQPANLWSPPPTAPYPEIVGEGDVSSLMLPDGSVQFYFTPTVNRCTPNPWNPNQSKCQNYGIWFIRSVSNTIPPPAPLPPPLAVQPRMFDYSPLRPSYASECNFNRYEHRLKFHNDVCTSTTDLFYFCPRRPLWPAAGVQVEMPVERSIYHTQLRCHEPSECPKPMEVSQPNIGYVQNAAKSSSPHSNSPVSIHFEDTFKGSCSRTEDVLVPPLCHKAGHNRNKNMIRPDSVTNMSTSDMTCKCSKHKSKSKDRRKKSSERAVTSSSSDASCTCSSCAESRITPSTSTASFKESRRKFKTGKCRCSNKDLKIKNSSSLSSCESVQPVTYKLNKKKLKSFKKDKSCVSKCCNLAQPEAETDKTATQASGSLQLGAATQTVHINESTSNLSNSCAAEHRIPKSSLSKKYLTGGDTESGGSYSGKNETELKK